MTHRCLSPRARMRARWRRQQAYGAQGKAASFLALRSLADELEAQASSWALLLQLYCSGDMPAGLGGPQLEGVGERRTYRQALRDAVTDDPLLLRWDRREGGEGGAKG